MFRLFWHIAIVIAIIVVVPESNETQQDAEKRGQQTIADVVKELKALKTGMNKELNVLKAQ